MPEQNKKDIDIFAAIGVGDIAKAGERKPHPRAPLPEKTLPATNTNNPYPTKMDKMETYEAFRARVEALKKQFAPYLKNYVAEDVLAKADANERVTVTEMDFMYIDSFRINPSRFAEETEGFERVTIPDIRGPRGKWAAVYRATVTLSKTIMDMPRQFIHFDGVDYRAEVYVNDIFVGSHEGFFSPFELDVTDVVTEGSNTLLIKVENDNAAHQGYGDKIYAATGFGWNEKGFGWAHCPPGAGITGDVYVTGKSDVYIEDAFVDTDIDAPALLFQIDVDNVKTPERVEGFKGNPEMVAPRTPVDFSVAVYAKNFDAGKVPLATYALQGGKTYAKTNCFAYKVPVNFTPKLWHFDTPYLYTAVITMKERETDKVLSTRCITFGFRKFESRLDTEPEGLFFLNNEKVFLRGANTMGHMQWAAAHKDYDQLIEDILIAKAANMNFYRMTQRPVHSAIYDHFDMLGMSCQTDFPFFANIPKHVVPEALRQVKEMEKLTRNHPSVFIESFVNEPMGDQPKRNNDESQKYLTLKEMDAFLFAARDVVSIYNPTRVLKPVDGVESCGYVDEQHVPYGIQDVHYYSLWYGPYAAPIDNFYAGDLYNIKPGVASSCGEYGVEALDSIEVMQNGKLWDLEYPRDWVPKGPDDAEWHPSQIYRSQQKASHFNWFTTPKTAGEWVEKSQAHQAFAARIMTEGFRLRMDMIQSTAIHLLIDAFPAGWLKTLVSFDRTPKASYYEFADSLAPVAVIVRSDRMRYIGGTETKAELWVCNDLPRAFDGYTIDYFVLRPETHEVVFSNSVPADIPASAATYQGMITVPLPEVAKRTPCVIYACLKDEKGAPVHDYTFSATLFPKVSLADTGGVIGLLATKETGIVKEYLTSDLGIKRVSDASALSSYKVLVIDCPETLAANEKAVSAFVEAGGAVYLIEQSMEVAWNFPSLDITIDISPNGKRNDGVWGGGHHALDFLAIDTGHPAVKGFDENDFSYWYSAVVDRRDFIAQSYVKPSCENTAIVRSNNLPVACEIAKGKGKIVASEILLKGRVSGHPVATVFLGNLFSYLIG